MRAWGARSPPTDANTCRGVRSEADNFRNPRVRANEPALTWSESGGRKGEAERGQTPYRRETMRPKRRDEGPLIMMSAGVEHSDVLKCVDADGIEMVKDQMWWGPVEGGKVRGKSGLKRVRTVDSPAG
jgi:hypothetical protein